MKTIELKNASARKPEWRLAEPVNFHLDKGEHVAIVGRNGGGKSMLVDMITGKHPVFPDQISYSFDEPYNNLKHITFRDTYGGDNDRTYFLQQRWNQMEIDEDTPTVGSKLEEAFLMSGPDTPERRAFQKHLYDLFGLNDLLDKYIILLSSGELRKFKLASNLFTMPKVLIIENPFIGLDAETRSQVKQLLTTLSAEEDIQIILVLSRIDEIPEFITRVVKLDGLRFVQDIHVKTSFPIEKCPHPILETRPEQNIPPLPQDVIRFNQVTIRYGERTILKDLNWVVLKGEHWSLSGQYGAGKSTLLSLVCADNPQAYANDISLFGHKRGSGESIWDIKKHIGYVSPEMHRSYKQNIPAIQIVASGLKDTVGLYTRPSQQEKDLCIEWMNLFGIKHLADRKFLEMSSGEQRLVLLARAFVKSPDLLILDEPLHGLDLCNSNLVKTIVDRYMFENPERTLIYVTHYENELPKCIDNSLYLKRQ
jgi:molybdate transport system ATP-binding protein